jgi:hypothetical protein
MVLFLLIDGSNEFSKVITRHAKRFVFLCDFGCKLGSDPRSLFLLIDGSNEFSKVITRHAKRFVFLCDFGCKLGSDPRSKPAAVYHWQKRKRRESTWMK